MSPETSKHLRIGTLVALSESEYKPDNRSSEDEHIDSCFECSTLYKFLVKYGKAAKESKTETLTKVMDCPKSDMDELASFFTFLKDGLPEEQARRFLNHINNCYSCFQIFITNWSSYLHGRKDEQSRKT